MPYSSTTLRPPGVVQLASITPSAPFSVWSTIAALSSTESFGLYVAIRPVTLADESVEPLEPGQFLYIGVAQSEETVIMELRIILNVGEGTVRAMPLKLAHPAGTEVLRPMRWKLPGKGWYRLLWDEWRDEENSADDPERSGCG